MKCLADITVRSIPHEFYRCELEAGHSGAHQDGRTIWTGPDTHYDFEPKAMFSTEPDSRFKDIWLYCMLDHGHGGLHSGPCTECISAYARTGPPNEHSATKEEA